MGVRVRKVQFDRTRCPRPTATSLGYFKFEAIGHVDARSVLLLGYRVDDGFASRIDNAGNDEVSQASVHVNVEIDACENRVMDLFEHRTVHLKEGRARFRVLAAHDAQDSVALRGAGTFIDDGDRLAV